MIRCSRPRPLSQTCGGSGSSSVLPYRRPTVPGRQPQAQVGAVELGRRGLQGAAGGERADHRVVGVQGARVDALAPQQRRAVPAELVDERREPAQPGRPDHRSHVAKG